MTRDEAFAPPVLVDAPAVLLGRRDSKTIQHVSSGLPSHPEVTA